MRHFFWSLVSATLLLGCSVDPDINAPSTVAIEEEILVLVNAHREAKKLDPLESMEIMASEARAHSQNMANGTSPFNHDGFDGRIMRIKNAVGGSSSGENIAKGQKTAQAVMDSWLSSPGHKANIEGNFDLIGIGVARKDNGPLFFTQIFLRN